MSVRRAKHAPPAQDLSGLDDPSIPCRSRDRRAVLLLHGFTGTPYELQSLVAPLAEQGFCIEAPRMPGHGEQPWELAPVRFFDWLAAARRAYRRLRDRYDEVVVVGLSMGGVLARALWREPRPPRRTVLLAPPARIEDPWGRRVLPWVRLLGFPRSAFVWIKDGGANLEDEAARQEQTAYAWTPLGAVAELNALLAWTRKNAVPAPQPALVVWGRHDTTVPEQGVRTVAAQAGPRARLLALAHSAHVLPRDVERAALATLVADYCAGTEPSRLPLPPGAAWLR